MSKRPNAGTHFDAQRVLRAKTRVQHQGKGEQIEAEDEIGLP